ncbi:hypothetical protein Tco_1463052 [Tanacetum coccineum]
MLAGVREGESGACIDGNATIGVGSNKNKSGSPKSCMENQVPTSLGESMVNSTMNPSGNKESDVEEQMWSSMEARVSPRQSDYKEGE